MELSQDEKIATQRKEMERTVCCNCGNPPPLAPPKTRPTRVKTDQNLKFFGDFEQNEYHGVSGLIPTNQEVKITELYRAVSREGNRLRVDRLPMASEVVIKQAALNCRQQLAVQMSDFSLRY